jgi:uncharacterized protein YidB (DUF937 family)
MSGFLSKALGSILGDNSDAPPNAGNLLNDVMSKAGGVQGLVGQFEQSGLGDHIKSWVGNGDNLPISPEEIEKVIPADQLDQFAASHGIPAGTVSTVLSQLLPHAVNAATPDGTTQNS